MFSWYAEQIPQICVGLPDAFLKKSGSFIKLYVFSGESHFLFNNFTSDFDVCVTAHH